MSERKAVNYLEDKKVFAKECAERYPAKVTGTKETDSSVTKQSGNNKDAINALAQAYDSLLLLLYLKPDITFDTPEGYVLIQKGVINSLIAKVDSAKKSIKPSTETTRTRYKETTVADSALLESKNNIIEQLEKDNDISIGMLSDAQKQLAIRDEKYTALENKQHEIGWLIGQTLKWFAKQWWFWVVLVVIGAGAYLRGRLGFLSKIITSKK